MQRLPQKSAPPSCERARGQPPFPWCSCSSPSSLGVGRGPGSTERREETETGSEWRDRKRETSASHLDGKIPPIPEIRMESPRQSMRLLGGSPGVSRLPSGLGGFNPDWPMRLREPLFAFALTRPFKRMVNTQKKVILSCFPKRWLPIWPQIAAFQGRRFK